MKHKRAKIGVALLVLLCSTGAARRAQAQAQPAPLTTQNSLAPNASLQVSGSASRFTVSANHADVQDVLKLLFDQAGKQFVLNNSVSGQVTLRLNEQPLGVTLNTICRQTFLRYSYDVTSGITYFDRDEAAVRTAFTRLRALDSALRDQLRIIGFEFPNDNQLGIPPTMQGNPLLNRAAPMQKNDDGRGGAGNAPGARSKDGLPGDTPPGSPEAAGRVKAMQEAQPPSPAGNSMEVNGLLDLSRPEDYQRFLQSNNFVSFQIPKDKPEPVYSVLQKLGQQAKVPVLIDPNVPEGSKFTIRGTLSPRSLPEALNILAPYAHLNWRWVGNTIYVTPSPDFQLFYGEETVPRASYSQQGIAGRRSASPAPASPAAPRRKKVRAEKAVGAGRRPMFKAKIVFFLSAIPGGVLFTGSAYLASQTRPQNSKPAPQPPNAVGTLCADYTHWQRVNPKPVQMDAAAAMRCRADTPKEAKEHARNPHFEKYVTVYVNPVGRDAMLTQRIPRYPVGTVIVKEKHPSDDTDIIELLTIMTKMQAGYDPQHGDWQYMTAGADRKVQSAGKIANCQSCHDKQSKTDYVFRNYLPHEVSAKLK